MSPTTISERASELRRLLSPCRLCPRACNAKRATGAPGFCRLTHELKVFCANLHPGEEPPISGNAGSGTIFFSGCNLRCAFCQNFPFSQLMNGEIMTPKILAAQMLKLQQRGAHNINWVTPSPQLPLALEALAIARADGLSIPLVYNCSGYEALDVLRLLDGIVDIYLPDAKYADAAAAQRLSAAPDYPAVTQAALREMFRQVGPLQMDAHGVATRGLIIRHLVLPERLAGTRAVLHFIAEELSRAVYVSLMAQYFPAHRAREFPEIARPVTEDEYHEALAWLDECGLHNGFIQEWHEQ